MVVRLCQKQKPFPFRVRSLNCNNTYNCHISDLSQKLYCLFYICYPHPYCFHNKQRSKQYIRYPVPNKYTLHHNKADQAYHCNQTLCPMRSYRYSCSLLTWNFFHSRNLFCTCTKKGPRHHSVFLFYICHTVCISHPERTRPAHKTYYSLIIPHYPSHMFRQDALLDCLHFLF